MPQRPESAMARDAPGVAAQPAAAPMYDLIELMFFAYRDFVRDADRILASDGFGRAHHRVLYFVARRPGLTIAELLDILAITKQSLNRVLNDLLDRAYVTTRPAETDRRCRLLFATAQGEALIHEIAGVQSARFARAFHDLGDGAKDEARAFLTAMTDRGDALPKAPQRLGFATGAFEVPDDFDRRGEAEIARLFGSAE